MDADLSRWDIVDTFWGGQVVALIAGIEPTELQSPEGQAQHKARLVPVRQRLEKAYGLSNGTPSGGDANSIALHTNYSIEPNAEAPFGAQNFERDEIVRWLAATGVRSAYDFSLGGQTGSSGRRGHWPWGDHHTELLGHLEAAALRFWVHYDPADPSTAPTNEDVAKWLMKERGTTQRMADSIATILRPDGLRTGPR